MTINPHSQAKVVFWDQEGFNFISELCFCYVVRPQTIVTLSPNVEHVLGTAKDT